MGPPNSVTIIKTVPTKERETMVMGTGPLKYVTFKGTLPSRLGTTHVYNIISTL